MASQQLSIHSRLQPYIPRLTLEWLATEPDRIHRTVEGTLVVADISGFTALSEKLAKLGQIGAEEMASAITTCFSDLLTVAYDEGGGLIKFGGDALLILFDGTITPSGRFGPPTRCASVSRRWGSWSRPAAG